MRRAIVCVTNDLVTDNRVHRTCTVLQELGYEVLLVGRKLPGSLPLQRPYATKCMRLIFRKGPLFYAEYAKRLFLLLLFARCSLIVANDLDTLLPVFLVARMRRKHLVYDSHEYFTEVPELEGRFARKVWLAIERWIFPKLRHVITVNDSIANAYRKRYGTLAERSRGARSLVNGNTIAERRGNTFAERSRRAGVPSNSEHEPVASTESRASSFDSRLGSLGEGVGVFDTRASTPLSEGVGVFDTRASSFDSRSGSLSEGSQEWITVVRNIPMPRELGPLPTRTELGLPADRFILVLQGSGINVQRGGEEAVLAMRELPGALLLLIGGGDAWPVLERLVQEHGLHDRVRLLPRMPYEEMMRYTRNADLGLSLDKDTNLNYRFSLPNKLFDYFRAGIPALVTDLPEVAGIVRKFGAGVVVPSPEPARLVAEVKALQADPARHSALREKATFAAASLNGASEKDTLKAFLQSIG